MTAKELAELLDRRGAGNETTPREERIADAEQRFGRLLAALPDRAWVE